MPLAPTLCTLPDTRPTCWTTLFEITDSGPST